MSEPARERERERERERARARERERARARESETEKAFQTRKVTEPRTTKNFVNSTLLENPRDHTVGNPLGYRVVPKDILSDYW